MSSKSGKGLSVPKFSSFKPSTSSGEGTDTGTGNRKETEQRKYEGKDRHDGGDRKDCDGQTYHLSGTGSTRHRHCSHDRNVKDESSRSKAHDAVPHRSPGIAGNVLYTIDKRGDQMIRKYGNSRYDVPRFNRFGHGHILGKDGLLRIEQLGNREEFTIARGGSGDKRGALSWDRKSMLARHYRSNSIRVRVDKPTAESHGAAKADDFMPLKDPKKRERKGSVSSESVDEDSPVYRSIHRKSKIHDHSDSDEIHDGDRSDSFTSFTEQRLDPLKVKAMQLSSRVKEIPQDIDAWFELVNNQDTILSLSKPNGETATAAEVKSYADIKLSLLEKALVHAGDPANRNKIRLRIMREGSRVWGPETTSDRWEALMEKFGEDFEIWQAYMTFRQTDLSSFRFEEIKDLYISKLKSMEAEFPTAEPESVIFDEWVVVLLRTTRFLADAGYTELAAAVWQAMLELHLCRPSNLPGAVPGVPSSFQEFWESEVPRMGEDKMEGWLAFEPGDEAPEPRMFPVPQATATHNVYKAWATCEQQRAMDAKVPARGLDEGIEDDPYRIVMYTDLQEFLSFVPTKSLSAIQPKLLDAFLAFYQLPPLFGCNRAADIMADDEILCGGVIAAPKMEPAFDADSNATDGSVRPPRFVHGHQRLAKSPETLISPSPWFCYVTSIRDMASEGQYPPVSVTLRQIASMALSPTVPPYFLSFDAIHEPHHQKKTAKRLLKQDPVNVDVYTGYANLEFSWGNKATGQNILMTALGFLKTIPEHRKLGLYINLAWMELEDGHLGASLLRICQHSEDVATTETMTPALLLKTRQVLTSKCDYLISTDCSAEFEIYAEALILLEYLSGNSSKEPRSLGQGDISSATERISNFSKELEPREQARTVVHERLLQFAARLLYFHTQHGPYRPIFFRDQIRTYLDYFPHNTIFLSLYAWRVSRMGLSDPVRDLLSSATYANHDLASDFAEHHLSTAIFSIEYESRVGTTHSVRAAFERAIASHPHHSGLWIAYLKYCGNAMRQKQTDLKAKVVLDVFYRAIRACPAVKELYMFGFSDIFAEEHDGKSRKRGERSEFMGQSEMRSVYDTMCEKGLRMHLDLDEFSTPSAIHEMG